MPEEKAPKKFYESLEKVRELEPTLIKYLKTGIEVSEKLLSIKEKPKPKKKDFKELSERIMSSVKDIRDILGDEEVKGFRDDVILYHEKFKKSESLEFWKLAQRRIFLKEIYNEFSHDAENNFTTTKEMASYWSKHPFTNEDWEIIKNSSINLGYVCRSALNELNGILTKTKFDLSFMMDFFRTLKKEGRVDYDVGYTKPLKIYGNEDAFYRVFLNLFSNADKKRYKLNRELDINEPAIISVSLLEKNNIYVIEVRDNAGGFSLNDLKEKAKESLWLRIEEYMWRKTPEEIKKESLDYKLCREKELRNLTIHDLWSKLRDYYELRETKRINRLGEAGIIKLAFERYLSGSASTGIGLNIATRYVERHGGKITAENYQDGNIKGALFRIYLPKEK